jgi:hypothetical protein
MRNHPRGRTGLVVSELCPGTLTFGGGGVGGQIGKLQQAMPEIDRDAWRAIESTAAAPAAEAEDPSWFAARSPVPATLLWPRVYRQSTPTLFEFRL